MSKPSVVRTRMAPSPTGDLHIGSLRTALYSYAFAKKHGGQFILRIEDTDQKRLVEGAMERTLAVVKDAGLTYDEGPDVGGPHGPYVQTQRLEIYKKYIDELLEKGLAYYCFCTPQRLEEMRAAQKAAKRIPKYDRHCLNLSPEEIKTNLEKGVPYVIRLRVPDNEVIKFKDAVRGDISFHTKEIDDQVLVKSNGIPTYHFAVVIDDHLMKVTHVLRGDEWISSTPKQIILYRYFGWEIPEFCHLTVLLDPSHPGKMSKRYGSVFVRQFLDDGYLPEALLNFLMLLGWNPGDDREIFSLEEFVQEFSLEHLHKKQPIFDRKKLDYVNGLYIRNKSDEQLMNLLKPFIPLASDETLKSLVPILKERLSTLKDATSLTKFLFEDVAYEKDLLLQRGATQELAIDMLTKASALIETLSGATAATFQEKIMELIKSNGWNVGQFFMVFRVAICGSQFTLPVVDCLPILGTEAALRKLNIALSKLSN